MYNYLFHPFYISWFNLFTFYKNIYLFIKIIVNFPPVFHCGVCVVFCSLMMNMMIMMFLVAECVFGCPLNRVSPMLEYWRLSYTTEQSDSVPVNKLLAFILSFRIVRCFILKAHRQVQDWITDHPKHVHFGQRVGFHKSLFPYFHFVIRIHV